MRPRTLVDLLRARAEDAPGNGYRFLGDGVNVTESLTYRELDRDARRIAALLQASGVAPGATVPLLFGPGLDFPRALFGSLYAGAIAVPVQPPHPARLMRTLRALRAVARDCGARDILTTAKIKAEAAQLLHLAPELRSVQWIAVDAEGPESGDFREVAASTDDLAFLQYTSGSTREPRGVMLSHANLLHNQELIRTAFAHGRDAVGVSWLPAHHDMGLSGTFLQPMYCGGSSLFLAPQAFLRSPFHWLQAVATYGAELSGGPNFAYDLCTRRITGEQLAALDLSQWRVAYCGAEPVRPETLERFAARFAPAGFRKRAFLPCYGLAEATLIVSGAARDADPVTDGRAVACGPATDGQELAIVDEQLSRCAPGTVGEIWVRGPSVSPGYWGRPDDPTFRGLLVGGDGPFLRTGDLGFLGGDGEFYVVGREKDLIIVRGKNHHPTDIEATVEGAWPGLRASAAFAGPDGGAVVVCEHQPRAAGDPVAWETVVEAVCAAVANGHELSLRAIAMVRPGQLPRTGSGKLQRFRARELYAGGGFELLHQWLAGERDDEPQLAAPAELRGAGEIEGFITAWLSAYLQRPVTASASFAPMGLDSLDVMGLVRSLGERVGQTLNPLVALDYPTVSSLSRHLAEKLSTDDSCSSST